MLTYSALTPGTLTLVALSSNYVLESHREKEELVQFQWQIQIRELRNTRIKSGSTIFSPFSIRCTVSVLDSKASVLLITFFKCCKLYKNYYCVHFGKSAHAIMQFWVINEFQTCDKLPALTLFYIEFNTKIAKQASTL